MFLVPLRHSDGQRPTEPCRFKLPEIAFVQDLGLAVLGVFPPLRGEDNHLDVEQPRGRHYRHRIVLVEHEPFEAVSAPGLGAKVAPQRTAGQIHRGRDKIIQIVDSVFHAKPPEVNYGMVSSAFFIASTRAAVYP